MLFDAKNFGAKVRLLRKCSSQTQEQLAEKLNTSTSYLGKIEVGSRTPSIDLLLDMAELFGVTVDELLRRSKTKIPSPEGIVAQMAMLIADLAISFQETKR